MAGSVILAVCAFILIFIANKDSIYPGLISFSSVSHTRKAPCPPVNLILTHLHTLHTYAFTHHLPGREHCSFCNWYPRDGATSSQCKYLRSNDYGDGVATAMGASVGGIYWLPWWGVIKGFNTRQNICVTAKTESM